jgi:NAD(P)H-hydrate epimerase
MKVLTAAETREVDRLTTDRCGIPSLALMENAGRSVAELIEQRFPHLERRQISVLCGKGNNGGDGFVVARYLLGKGAKPRVFLFAAPGDIHGDAAANLKRWQEACGELHIVRNVSEWQSEQMEFSSTGVIVDALLGTGVRGPAEGLFQQVMEDVNRNRPPGSSVVSVDIPSGLLADTGEMPGEAIGANYTVTFTAPKPCLLSGTGNLLTGRLVVRDIGSPPELIEEVGKGMLRWVEPRELETLALPRMPFSNKGNYGHALIVAGSVGKSGAAVLASRAALRVGVGLVTVATPEPVLPTVAAQTPEVMTEPLVSTLAGTVSTRSFETNFFSTLLTGKRSLAIGPGLTTQIETQEFVRAVVGMRSRMPMIVDADGLNAYEGRAGELRDPNEPVAITPHPGEMARLLGCSVKQVQSQRIEIAKKAAADWNLYVVLKGHQTVIAAPDGQAWINGTGNPGMATGGTGDVLTGMLAGLVAQYPPIAWGWWRSLIFGVYLHGLAGDIAASDVGEAALMASDLISAIPRAFRQFHAECGRD